MRKLAFPKSVEGISEEKVKSDFTKSYKAEDKAVEKLLGVMVIPPKISGVQK